MVLKRMVKCVMGSVTMITLGILIACGGQKTPRLANVTSVWDEGTVRTTGGDTDDNHASLENATVSGGAHNVATASYATVSGGSHNTASVAHSVVAGGSHNSANATRATIGGGYGNRVTNLDATISGGGGNVASGRHATVGGGSQNTASGFDAIIAGGAYNVATGNHATVGGGTRNFSDGFGAYVGGGAGNKATETHAAVAGGLGNRATAIYGTVGGGNANVAGGAFAAVPGGFMNQANGDYSFAGGRNARVAIDHAGTFLYADAQELPFDSVAANEFAVRATGGVRFVTAIDDNGRPISSVTLEAASGTWSSLSDRETKAEILPVDTYQILVALANLPISTWSYVGEDPSTRHIGPMAEDFYIIFGVGNDARYISVMDADGVALAAIQALYELTKEQEARIASLEARLDVLEKAKERP